MMADAGVKVTIKIPKPKSPQWSCRGANLSEAFESLESHGWWGRYHSNESYQVKKADSKTKMVTAVELGGKPQIIMPKWAGYAKGSKDQKKSWDKMAAALLSHENEHHTIFEDVMGEFRNVLEGEDELDKGRLKKLWEQEKKSLQKRQNQHDAKTKNGKNQGVVLMLTDDDP